MTRKKQPMTGEQMRRELAKRGYPVSPPVLGKLTAMLDDLGLVEKVERPGMAPVNMVAPATVDRVARYLQARADHEPVRYAKHSAELWRMLDNLGYM